ncbi:Glycosyltransferase, GT2 family [Pustulibacterium marinum]|uniref:Glycosyltransferase, GT2 family n=1 Tax=Pustulibacterium marinum TaxID=1224947 RepID=A0A1I7HMH8_9FLAO|nr:glycosyltransferase [Pustulibacterium marinum]SFU61908.1 Glycosyltransferase, GT2 family [Pustulibacterium marinum]
MKISFLIVTRNRVDDLRLTLVKLKAIMNIEVHEVLVFIDGCEETQHIKVDYSWVRWFESSKSISASPARNNLYQHAKGDIFIGLDDDAHPISQNFIEEVQQLFVQYKNLGIIAFQEVRGLFKSDDDALHNAKKRTGYFTNDFVGCGFAIKKTVYQETNGFPLWVDIYGEEPSLSLEVLDAGYDIFYSYAIIVNHRVDVVKRKLQKKNYFRFEHQLANEIKIYAIYYPNPTKKIAKLLFHNFRKYALSDITYFKIYVSVLFSTLMNIGVILKNRKPVKKEIIKKRTELQAIKYT